LIVVLDTNIWVSALQFGKNYGPPARTLEKAMQRDTIAISDEMEAEVFHTLVQKFKWPPQKAREAIEIVLKRSIRYPLQHTVLAKAGYIVAGDKDLLVLGVYGSTRIITPLEYISLP